MQDCTTHIISLIETKILLTGMEAGDGRSGQALPAQRRAGALDLWVLAVIILAISAVACKPLLVVVLAHLWPLGKVTHN